MLSVLFKFCEFGNCLMGLFYIDISNKKYDSDSDSDNKEITIFTTYSFHFTFRGILIIYYFI